MDLMKLPKYLSPSSRSLFYTDRREYYLKYLADERPPRMPQTKPMSVGSSFDAYIKSYLHKRLFGVVEPKYELDTLLKSQVESQNLDWAIDAGKICFEQYKESGAIADLMIELEKAIDDPRFEFKVEGRLLHEDIIDGIPIVGYPDLYFKLDNEAHVIYDFKVNGFCAKSNTSPKPGYIMCRDGWAGKQSRSHRTSHKNAHISNYGGIKINVAGHFESVDDSWAAQLTTYGWLEGVSVGDKMIAGIEQLACSPGPKIRVASHRGLVSKPYQLQLLGTYAYQWKTIHSGHIFDDLTREESDQMCATLDDIHKAYNGDNPIEKWFTNSTRQH